MVEVIGSSPTTPTNESTLLGALFVGGGSCLARTKRMLAFVLVRIRAADGARSRDDGEAQGYSPSAKTQLLRAPLGDLW